MRSLSWLWLLPLAACQTTQGNVLSPLDGGTCLGLPCGGCCDPNGVCQAGDSVNACGAGASQCVACGAGQTCSAGACTPDAGADAGPILCRPCVVTSDCAPNGLCVQYDNSDYCGVLCNAEIDCPTGQVCIPTLTFNGSVVAVCAPANGSCGTSTGCGTCDAGTSCDVTTATCVPVVDAGPPGEDAGTCGPIVGPSISSCCQSCTPGMGDCQSNGCYGGWWCNTTGGTCDKGSCCCQPPPTSCGDGGIDAGVYDGGVPTGSIGPDGGTVSRLYFAVLGDTRPDNQDDTPNYPKAVIDKIFQEIAALNPPVQFVISTGDFMFATPSGTQGAAQAALFEDAADQFTNGPVFAVMGNQECTGYTSDNCTSGTTGNNNYAAYVSDFLAPLGKSLPYYTVTFRNPNATWTAKLLVIACNGWDSTQSNWLANSLAQPTTYTFLARHEPLGTSDTPCGEQSDPMISGANYNQLFVGHTHVYAKNASTKTAIIGNGGAPGSSEFGFITVEQQPGIGFQVVEYDWATGAQIDSWTFQ